MRNDSTIILENLILLSSTEKAYLIRNFDGHETWIPKSQTIKIEFGRDLKDTDTGNQIKEITELEIPEWLAENKNLI